MTRALCVMRKHRHPYNDRITETLLGGFDNWESEWYLYIGYTFLQSMAFFPLYPHRLLVELFYSHSVFCLLTTSLQISSCGNLGQLVCVPLAAVVFTDSI